MKLPLLAGGLLLAALPTMAVTIIADTVMANANYNGPLLSGVTISGTGSSSFSNPLDLWREIQLDLPAADLGNFINASAAVGDTNIAHTFTPTIAVPLSSLTMSIDVQFNPDVAGPNGTLPDPAATFFFYFRQGSTTTNVLMVPLTNGTKLGQWTGNLTGGAPLFFGYGFANMNQTGAPASLRYNFDNFCVIANEAGSANCSLSLQNSGGPDTPEPASIATLGGALAALALLRRRRRQCR